jgi:hypothetical protein
MMNVDEVSFCCIENFRMEKPAMSKFNVKLKKTATETF